MSAKARGRFIVLEGLDGAGTTTQAERLGAWLRSRGRRVHVTAEPTSGPIGGLIRQALSKRFVGHGGEELDPRALALLFAADRLDHYASDIAPKLAQGIDVVCDRYVLSSIAYQGVQNDRAWVEVLNAQAPPPDLTLFLAVSPRVALRRRHAVSVNREIYEVDRFQRLVAKNYHAAVARLGRRHRVVSLDGERPIDDVTAAVISAVGKLA